MTQSNQPQNRMPDEKRGLRKLPLFGLLGLVLIGVVLLIISQI
jgi:hypothetical protein